MFELQLLHATDQEGASAALVDAPNLSAVVNALEDDFENTLILSSGDLWLPGLFYSASAEIYGFTNTEGEFEGVPGIADVLINNAIGIQAAAFGNHEFDQGTAAIAALLAANPDITGPGIGAGGYSGTAFPYLSANLEFAADENLAALVTEDGQDVSDIANNIAKSAIATVNGEQIGLVGATTPTLSSISSPGEAVGVSPVIPDDYDALAAIIQAEVDELLANNPDLNKVILLSHMQVLGIEVDELAPRLTDVDIIIGGGSDTILADDTDRLRDGDTAAGPYPILQTAADGNPIAIVNTDGQYLYVGQLVVTFDENGILIEDSIDPAVSGAYATDAQGVADLDAEDLVDPVVAEVIAALNEVIAEKEENLFGITEEFLNGRRAGGGLDGVRNQETNLGNLTADANLWYGQQADPAVQISIKNGGGIRESIGSVVTPPGGTNPVRLPPEGSPVFNKPPGGITQTDVESVLAFNNGLSVVTVTPEELKDILEHTVSGATPDNIDSDFGSFGQVSGIEFSFDIDFQPRETDPVTGAETTDGERVRSVALVDEDGNVTDVLVQDGEIQGNPDRTFRLITLNFLADGGSNYPIPQTDRVDLVNESALVADALTVGDFSIGFDPDRVSDTTSGLFVEDTVTGLGVLFDIGTLPLDEAEVDTESFLRLGPTDLLLSPELASTLTLPELTGADVGDARVDALVETATTPNTFNIMGGTTSVALDRNALRFGAQLNLTDAESTGTPFDDSFQVGFPIAGDSTATVTLPAGSGITGFEGAIAHTGTVTLNQEYASFAEAGSEQDALAEYLAAFFPGDDNPATPAFSQADTSRAGDERIQNLLFREDTVLNGLDTPTMGEVAVESGVTSVFLDTAVLESAASLVLAGADSEATPFSDDFQVGFAINDETDFTYDVDPFAPVSGTIEHNGTVTFNPVGDPTTDIVVGEFSIGFDPARVSDSASGFFVADTLAGNDLEVLFDISAPGTVDATTTDLTLADADLLLANEFASALGIVDLTGADVGDARIDALAADDGGVGDNSGAGGQVEFAIAAGETAVLTDFGGIGQGSQPTAATISEVDTLVFSGEGLTARNLQLTQVDDDLEITFRGDDSTQIRLVDFALDRLDNLRQETGGNVDRGNIRFSNETGFEDSFDVFNADSTQDFLWNENTVTFLNDLDNEVEGFSQSDDVINGLGGDDTLEGLSGDDTLRGDAGDDLLDGGQGDDIYTGGSGADQFVFAEGAGIDVITDFEVGIDQILLGSSLSVDRVQLLETSADTLVVTENSNELVGIVQGVTGLSAAILA